MSTCFPEVWHPAVTDILKIEGKEQSVTTILIIILRRVLFFIRSLPQEKNIVFYVGILSESILYMPDDGF